MKNKDTALWIFKKFKNFIPAVILLCVLSSLVSISSVALIMIVRRVLNDAQVGITGSVLIRNIVLLVIVLIAQIVINVLDGFLRNKTMFKMDMQLKDCLFGELIRKDYKKITAFHSGELVNRFSSDVDVVVRGFSSIIPSAVSLIVKLVAGVVVIAALSPVIAVFVVLVGFIFPFLGRIISKKYKNLHKEVQRTDGTVRSFLQECIQNIIVIKTFSANNPVRGKLSEYLKDNFKIKMKRTHLSILMNNGLYSTFTLGYYAVFIWGAIRIAEGTLQYGTFFAFLNLVSLLRTPLQNISGLIPQYFSTIASAERLIELEQVEDEKFDSNVDTNMLYDNMKSICAEGLCFSYDDDHTVIDSSDFSIEKGSICALMGKSGIGKSTLFKLLLGLYAQNSGRLFIKTDAEDIAVDSSLRSLFSYVPQGVMVLSGTIRENITFLSGDVSKESLENATRQADIYDFITSLPQGFDTPIGERGLGLSEGQLQRIAIARALLADAPILLLDECTSALDMNTERKILENLKNERNKTVILITHRRAALDICDTVLMLEDGKITHK